MRSGLSEVQAYCFRRSWPESLLFRAFSDAEVMDEEAFNMAWAACFKEHLRALGGSTARRVYLPYPILPLSTLQRLGRKLSAFDRCQMTAFRRT